MYAIIQTGGKQYRVEEGDTLRIEKLAVSEGDSVDFDRVLMLGEGDSVTVGAPTVDGAKVSATVLGHGRDDKIHVVKFKRRKQYLRRQGHRQHFTEVKVTAIAGA